MRKILEHPQALCNMVRRTALSAGEIILDYYDGVEENEIFHKEDGTIVSLADQKAEAHIVKELYKLLPDVPVIGEELYAAGEMPEIENLSGHFWLVDALDGTREFVAGGNDFTVNIALIHNHSPVLGVVYAPVTGFLYAACGAGTAIRWNEETQQEKSIHVRNEPRDGLVVARSRGHGHADKLDAFIEQFKVRKQMKMGSSLKMCLIAEGKVDIYPRFGPTCLWDTAAAHAILDAAGGYITDIEGRSLSYAPDVPQMLNPEFIASSFAWWEDDTV